MRPAFKRVGNIALVAGMFVGMVGGVAADEASPIPLTDRDSFLAYVAFLLKERLPGMEVAPDVGMASMLVTDPDGVKLGHLDIQERYQWCRAKPQECNKYVSSWLDAANTAVQDQMRVPDRNAIHIMVGPAKVFEEEAGPRAASAPQIIVRRGVGDLVAVLYADHPGSPRYLDSRQLAKLEMTEDQAFELGDSNIHTELRPISALKAPSAEHPIQYVDYSAYESSRILWVSDWAPLAQQLGGELIAAIPASNLFVYAKGGSSRAIDDLRRFAENAYPSANRPVSTAVFQWTPAGWRTLP